jgi:hypothetical protein
MQTLPAIPLFSGAKITSEANVCEIDNIQNQSLKKTLARIIGLPHKSLSKTKINEHN